MLKLEGNTIYLSPLDHKHASLEYVDWLNDCEINQYLESRHTLQNMSSVRQFIDNCNQHKDIHLFGIFTNDGMHIGNIKAGPEDNRNKKIDVGLMIGNKEYWGKNIGTEAIELITKYIFDNLDINRIEAGCYEDNIGSKKAFEKNGYSVEGFRKEAYLVDGHFQGCWYLGLIRKDYEVLNG